MRRVSRRHRPWNATNENTARRPTINAMKHASYFLLAIRRFTVVTSSDQVALRFW
jgi:hypothetical protein